MGSSCRVWVRDLLLPGIAARAVPATGHAHCAPRQTHLPGLPTPHTQCFPPPPSIDPATIASSGPASSSTLHPHHNSPRVRDRQRLIVNAGHNSSLLLSLRNVAITHGIDRYRFTVHSQPLTVIRLRFGDKKQIRQTQQMSGGGSEIGGFAVSEALLPIIYLYTIRIPPLHKLHLLIDAVQPVVLAASEDDFGGLVSSSPRALAEGFPGSPAELTLGSSEVERTVYVGVTLLTPAGDEWPMVQAR